jgi:hypothetical protein
MCCVGECPPGPRVPVATISFVAFDLVKNGVNPTGEFIVVVLDNAMSGTPVVAKGKINCLMKICLIHLFPSPR